MAQACGQRVCVWTRSRGCSTRSAAGARTSRRDSSPGPQRSCGWSPSASPPQSSPSAHGNLQAALQGKCCLVPRSREPLQVPGSLCGHRARLGGCQSLSLLGAQGAPDRHASVGFCNKAADDPASAQPACPHPFFREVGASDSCPGNGEGRSQRRASTCPSPPHLDHPGEPSLGPHPHHETEGPGGLTPARGTDREHPPPPDLLGSHLPATTG